MISPGRYKARATDAQLGFTEGGKEQVAVAFEIVSDGDHCGETITWYGYFTEKTTERTFESLRTCGWDSDDLSQLDGVRGECEIVVEHEEDQNGKERARVKWVNRPGAGGVSLKNKMSDGQRLSFAERMKGAAMLHRQKSGANAAPAQRAAPKRTEWDGTGRAAPEDDIPF